MMDEFSARLQSAAAGRMINVRQQHREQSNRLLAKLLAEEFGDHELTLLDKLGFLSPGDRAVLRRAGKPVRRLAGVEDVA